jgi:hypothetical protein
LVSQRAGGTAEFEAHGRPYPSRDVYAAGVVLFALMTGTLPQWGGGEIRNWPEDVDGGANVKADREKIEWIKSGYSR